MRHLILVILLLLLEACAAVTPPKRPPPTAQPQFKNLRVLPRDISKDDLIGTMRSWSDSLGAGCDQGHQRTAPALPGERGRLDFTSDAMPDKNVARAMLTMTRRMNVEYVMKVTQKGSTVSCYTCHRGKSVPESTPPPQATGR